MGKHEKRILVIYTGGTIGSVRYVTKDGREIIGQPKDIIKCYPEAKDYFKSSNAITLLCRNFYNEFPSYRNSIVIDNKLEMEILSENMSIDKWNALLNILRKYDFSQYEGVIITHGTDTLAYTANLLAMIFNKISVPLFLVSSGESLDVKGANGIYNFKAAIDFILNEGIPGIYVSYKNSDAINTDIFYASRIIQCKQVSDKFESISESNLSNLGSIDINGNFWINDQKLMQKIKNDENISLTCNKKVLLKENKILRINPYVGLDYDIYNVENCKAILHQCYHSGTACTIGSSNNSILNFIRSCDDMNIDFYYGPVYGNEDRAVYDTTYAVMKAGAKIVRNLSSENAYVKMLLGYSLGLEKDQLMKYIDDDVNKEHIFVKKR